LKTPGLLKGTGLLLSGVLVFAACSAPPRGNEMRFPPHLFKPNNAIEVRLQKQEPVVPDGTIQVTFYEYTPPVGIITVVKDFASTNTVNAVKMDYYKNDVHLFFEGLDPSLPLYKRQEHFWGYLRENPIILTENDTLKLKVTNQSGAPQAVQMEIFGYSYPVWQEDKERGVLAK
jgi:hypothetical protein